MHHCECTPIKQRRKAKLLPRGAMLATPEGRFDLAVLCHFGRFLLVPRTHHTSSGAHGNCRPSHRLAAISGDASTAGFDARPRLLVTGRGTYHQSAAVAVPSRELITSTMGHRTALARIRVAGGWTSGRLQTVAACFERVLLDLQGCCFSFTTDHYSLHNQL